MAARFNARRVLGCGAFAALFYILILAATLVPYGIFVIAGTVLLVVSLGLVNPRLVRLENRRGVIRALEIGVTGLATATVAPLLSLISLDALAALAEGRFLEGIGPVREFLSFLALPVGLAGLWLALLAPDRVLVRRPVLGWLIIGGLVVFAIGWVYLNVEADVESLIGGRTTYWLVLVAPLAVTVHQFSRLMVWKLRAGESGRGDRI